MPEAWMGFFDRMNERMRRFYEREERRTEQRWGLAEYDLNQLATYNSERGRGIVHSPEYQTRMADLQERFDAAARAESRSFESPEGVEEANET